MKPYLFLASLLLASCAPQAVSHRLVDLSTLPHPPKLDVRYATKDNFTRTRLYPLPKAYLHQDAANALEGVQQDLARQGLGVKVFDGYRPLSVQKKMWDLIRDERYVSNPAINRGRHTRGTAVDLTLVDKHGRELDMGTAFDDFSERAHSAYPRLPSRVKRNRALLANAMMRHGFEVYPYEWWHFDFRNWQRYPVLDLPIDRLAAP